MRALWLEGGKRFSPKIQQELGAKGITVTPVQEVAACLANLAADPADTVIIDLDLTKKGIEAVQQIHETAPDIPVIVLASLERLPVVDEAFKHGAWDSVIKQLDLSHLYEVPRAIARCEEKKVLLAAAGRHREEAEKLQAEVRTIQENAERSKSESQRYREEAEKIKVEMERYREQAESAQAAAKPHQVLTDIIDDLQTPLAAMLGYLEIASTISPDQAEPNQVLSIKRSELMARRLLDLISSHIGAMEVDTKRLEIHKSPLQIDQILEPAVQARQSEANIKNIEIVVDIAKDLPPVAIDGVQIERAIGILLSNAINLSPLGGSVNVSASLNGNEVALAIADSGSGLSPEELPSLFDRSKKLRRPAGDINTVGLYLAHQIVSKHGGRIDAKSESLEGTTLTIFLPR